MTENTLEKIVEVAQKDFDREFWLHRIPKNTMQMADIHDFIRTFALTVAQATSDAVSVEERDERVIARGAPPLGFEWNAAKKEMHERFTRFISKTP